MFTRIVTAALVMTFSLLCWSDAAFADWKYRRPGGSWQHIWEKQGAPQLESQWQYECSVAKPEHPDQYASTRRYLAVYSYNPIWIFVECFYDRDPERVVRPQLPPSAGEQTLDIFNPTDGRNLPSQRLEYPFVPAPGRTQGPLRMAINNNLCLDVASSRLDEGAVAQLFPCHGGPNQQVLLSRGQRGQIVVMPGSKNAQGYPMCLDYWPGQGVPGDYVKMYTCHALSTGVRDSQVWNPVHLQLRSITGRCLGTTSNGAGSGYLVLQNCPPEPNVNNAPPTPVDW
jgi:hypothetical protein